jgi:hypothetical protein
MSEQEYDDLWHYSEQFTRDKLQRSELVTMAWKEGVRLGERATPNLMKSMMHFRAKELDRRSAFPAEEVGKRTIDAWNKPERVYLDRPASNERGETLAEFLLPMKTTPLDFTIANDFMDALTHEEQLFLADLTAGFRLKEISERNHFDQSRLQFLRQSVQRKAISYL